ncbi:MAG: hypothetical protein HY278_08760 [candidate division NC10 bacterium]|nr:hypothetical protein [candidate division NC10 bacterium]
MRQSVRTAGFALAIGFLVLTLLSPVIASEPTTWQWEGIAIALGAGLAWRVMWS